MQELKLAHENLTSALIKLEEAIDHFEYAKKSDAEDALSYMNREALIESLRDSLIQRFEFCVDLFWKYLKKYLVIVIKITPEFGGPKPTIRESCKVRMISEVDAEKIIQMLDNRNLTSHTYKEEFADRLSAIIPEYFKIMRNYADKLKHDK